jgi:hypothetical protein
MSCGKPFISCHDDFAVRSIVGAYGGFLGNIPLGSAFRRGRTFRMAQTPVQQYLPKLMQPVEDWRI